MSDTEKMTGESQETALEQTVMENETRREWVEPVFERKSLKEALGGINLLPAADLYSKVS